MPVGVTTVKLDLNGDGVAEEDVSAYLLRDRAISGTEIGRSDEFASARKSSITLRLDNRDGRFSPKKASSPYFDNFHPQIAVLVEVAWNAVTYPYFVGLVEEIDVKALKTEGREVWLRCVDWMHVLAKSDSRLPLIEDRTSGVAINRLIDEAERGELVTNKRFKDDLAGYSALGSAAIARVTTDGLLHPPAAMDTTGLDSADDGWRYAIPHAADADLQSKHTRAVVYVWAELPADVGKTVLVRLADNTASGSTTEATLTAEPQMVRSPSYQFAGAATDFYIEVLRGTTTPGAVFRTGLAHAVPAAAAIPRGDHDGVASIDLGQSRLARPRYNRVKALGPIMEVADSELGGLFYFDEAGLATFEDRQHRWRETEGRVSQVTLDETMHGLSYRERSTDRLSGIAFDFPRYVDGAAGTIVWTSDRVPILIPASSSITVEADYRGALVRASIVPVSTTDYKANASPDGGGADETGNVTIDFESFGGASTCKFTNGVARPIWLTLYKNRATPVRLATDRTPIRATATTVPLLLKEPSHAFRWNAEQNAIQNFADYLVERWGDIQRERLSVKLIAPWTDSPTTGLAASILGRQVSDRVTIVNDDDAASAAINAAYYIDSLKRVTGKTLITAEWRLSPVDKAYAIWDTDSWDGTPEWGP